MLHDRLAVLGVVWLRNHMGCILDKPVAVVELVAPRLVLDLRPLAIGQIIIFSF
jgi:hypothetical protein